MSCLARRPVLFLAGLAIASCAACDAGPGDAAESTAVQAGTSEGQAASRAAVPTGTAEVADPLAVSHPLGVDLDRPVRVGFLIVDGVYNSELVAPYDIFHHPLFHTVPKPGMVVFTIALEKRPVETFEGLRILPDFGFEQHPEIDVLVVPSAENSMGTDLEDKRMIGWVREIGGRAAYVVSLCDGAFVLAKAGLLDGKAVTTFPGDQDAFAEMFPKIDLRREPSYVHDGNVITSQGGALSYDPAMRLVAHLYGDDVAKKVGRGLILPWPPRPTDPAATGLVIEH